MDISKVDGAKGKAVRENTRLAYDIYSEMGGNVAKTLRELGKRGLKLSRPTLDEWIVKFNYKERLAKADKESREAQDCKLSLEQRVMKKLFKQIDKYEAYLDALDGVDNQAVFAYMHLLKTVVEVSRKGKVNTKDPVELKRLAEDARKEYGL